MDSMRMRDDDSGGGGWKKMEAGSFERRFLGGGRVLKNVVNCSGCLGLRGRVFIKGK